MAGKKKKRPEQKKEESLMVDLSSMKLNGAASKPEPRLIDLRGKALEWALENGLRAPLRVAHLERVNYPKWGFGFVASIQEVEGRQRTATARFDSEGNPSYWSIDGNVVL